ncbi:phage P2 GpU family protein, partial [Escherichia coli 88.1467]
MMMIYGMFVFEL